MLLSSYFGTKHFLIYDWVGLPGDRFYRRVIGRARAKPDPSLDVRVAPWNWGLKLSEEEAWAVAKADCLARTKG